ncbi:histone-lysine N-methyltransferase SETMAR [Trichonephila clavipes]|nr:histone-lysine N-methyltransferase SETMAR [Trichonephila clavipes]
MDKKWVLWDNHKCKPQWLHINELAKQTPKPNFLPRKNIVFFWWTVENMAHYEFLSRGQIINADMYRWMMPQEIFYQTTNTGQYVSHQHWLNLHDEVFPHVSVGSQQNIQGLGYKFLPQPPYCLANYHMFHQLTRFMRDKQFLKQNVLIQEIRDQCDADFSPEWRFVTGSRVFSLTCPLGSLGPELMATLFQPNPRSKA